MAQLGQRTLADTAQEHVNDHNQLHDKANYVFDVRDFGAVGDGVTDDTTAIQSAIDAAESVAPAVIDFPFPDSYYSCVSALTVEADGLTFRGDRSEIRMETASTILFNVNGSAGSDLAILADISEGDTTFTVSAGDGDTLAAGDWLRILTDEYYSEGPTDYGLGEMVKVVSESAGTVTIEEPGFVFDYAFSGTNLAANLLTQISDITFEGMVITGTGGTDVQQGIHANVTNNLLVKDCELARLDIGIQFFDALHSQVVDSYFHDIFRANAGLAVSVAGVSRNTLVANNRFEANRHAVTTSGIWGVTMGLTIIGNVASNHLGSGANPFDTHGNARYTLIADNQVSNSQRGIQNRSPYTTIRNNVISNCVDYGILCAEGGCVNTTIVGNTIHKVADNSAIRCSYTNTAQYDSTFDFLTVEGNSIVDNGANFAVTIGVVKTLGVINVRNNQLYNIFGGIFLDNAAQINVIGNMVSKSKSPASGNTTAGIRIDTMDAGITYENSVSIIGNIINEMGRGVTIPNADIATIVGNVVTLNGAYTDYSLGTITSLFHAGNSPPVAIPDITGARDDGTALADLLTSLAGLILITDSTTAS